MNRVAIYYGPYSDIIIAIYRIIIPFYLYNL